MKKTLKKLCSEKSMHGVEGMGWFRVKTVDLVVVSHRVLISKAPSENCSYRLEYSKADVFLIECEGRSFEASASARNVSVAYEHEVFGLSEEYSYSAAGRYLDASVGLVCLDQLKERALRVSASARNAPVADVREAFGFMPVDIEGVEIHWPSL